MITVLTPSYNRAYILKNAYNSLLKQTNKNFEWIIVDDGSTDNTKELVQKFVNDKKITIRYFKKSNGGKHTALNYGIKKAKGELLLILDSDDILTNSAIETVYKYHNKYKNHKNLCGYSFIKVFPNYKKIGKPLGVQEVISNHIDFRYNKNNLGDMEEVFKTSILKKYAFPVFNNERFLSEAIVWNKIALDYDTVYVNDSIYIADYIEDGLSKNFFKLVYRNPIGALENSNMFLIDRFKLSIRIKNAILYNGYCLTANYRFRKSYKKSNCKFLTTLFFVPGIMFYLYLKIKNISKFN